jgi:hypothetical protein
MCCDPRETREAQCCIPSCCCPGTFPRRFVTTKERREWLEEYKAQLEKEISGVEERIQELKGD